MKVGDLVRWRKDNDLGIVLDFVQGDSYFNSGNPIIKWFLHTHEDGIDDSIDLDDYDLEILNESR